MPMFFFKKCNKIKNDTDNHLISSKNSLSREEFQKILIDLSDDVQKISKYIYDKKTISRFSQQQLGEIATNSLEHCEFLLKLKYLQEHPRANMVIDELETIKWSFLREIYSEPSK